MDYDGIEFPVSDKDYSKVEAQNSINVNVIGYEGKQFYLIYASKAHNKDELNLLLITEDEKKHYVLIKDVCSLLYNKTRHKGRKHFCKHCFQCFSSEQILAKHKTNCMLINDEQAIRTPE